MYHEVTYEQIKRRRRTRVGYAVLLAIIAVAVAFSVSSLMGVARQQSAQSVKTAVMERAVQCMAVEGSYPSSLEYLERSYGLVVNKDDYVVTYEWLGDNVPPSVTVRPR